MIWLLHGAVGLPSDWKGLAEELGREGHVVRSVDLYRYLDCCPMSLEEFGRAFCEEVAAIDEQAILVGYSMGGRLALHALLHQPKMWQGAYLLSTHPGLQEDQEKFERMVVDAEWAAQALSGEWSTFIQKWNEQSVLQSAPLSSRASLKNRRQALARSFMDWTLSKQEDLRGRLHEINCPVHWVTGERDEKFTKLAKTIPFPKQMQSHVIPNAGHRLLNDVAPFLKQELKKSLRLES